MSGIEPDLAQLILDAIDSRLLDVHTSITGRVQTYNATKQVADVVPCVKRAYLDADGGVVHEDLPVIPNVPVMWPRGGGFALHFPLKAGDHVELFFQEAAIASWRDTGDVCEPGDLRRHSLSYPIAIAGISQASKPIKNADASKVTFGREEPPVPILTACPVVAVTDTGFEFGDTPTEHVMTLEATCTLIFNVLAQLMIAAASAGVTPLTPTGLQTLIGAAITQAVTLQNVPAPPGLAAQIALAATDAAAYASGAAPMFTSGAFIASPPVPKTPNVSGVCPGLCAGILKCQ